MCDPNFGMSMQVGFSVFVVGVSGVELREILDAGCAVHPLPNKSSDGPINGAQGAAGIPIWRDEGSEDCA
jgi:hypothetical protein